MKETSMRVRSAEQRLDERNARFEWVIPGAQLLARVGEFWITSHESVLFFAYTRPKRVLDQKLSLLQLTNQRIRHNAWALTEVLAISFR